MFFTGSTKYRKAVAYYRHSAEDKQENSVPLQRDFVRELLKRHDVEIIHEEADEGVSGLTANRPGFSRLFQNWILNPSAPQFDYVVVYDVSRWERFEDADEAGYYEFQCKQAGKEVVYARRGFSTEEQRGMSQVQTAFERWMSFQYSKKLSEDVIRGCLEISSQGYSVGGQAPYGLARMLLSAGDRKPIRIMKDGEHKSVANERITFVPKGDHTTATVVRIFSLFDSGFDLNGIAEQLNQEGSVSANGTPWSKGKVLRILSNPAYKGTLVYNKTWGRLHKKKRDNPVSQWVVCDNAFEAVIEPERFELVRKMWDLMLTGNYNPTKIVEIANREWGFLTPKRHRSGGKPLADSMVYKMFTNKFYTGIVCYSGNEYQGAHEPMVTLDEFERVQFLLGSKSKPKPQTHEFPFTGIIHCGTCGCFVTAEEKVKHYKTTGKTGCYTYYRCTKRKKHEIKCHEPAITKEDLEEQISKEILKFTIDPEFRDFALAKLRRNNDREIEARTQARSTLENTYNETQRQLDNLTKMRYRDLIDDETFKKERASLQQELTKTQQRLNETHDRAEKWLELTEQAFHFATNAYAIFKAGNLKTKREIFNTIGTSYTLKDGRLSIEQKEWIIPISNAAKDIKNDIERLELLKNASIDEKTPAFAEVYSRWGG